MRRGDRALAARGGPRPARTTRRSSTSARRCGGWAGRRRRGRTSRRTCARPRWRSRRATSRRVRGWLRRARLLSSPARTPRSPGCGHPLRDGEGLTGLGVVGRLRHEPLEEGRSRGGTAGPQLHRAQVEERVRVVGAAGALPERAPRLRLAPRGPPRRGRGPRGLRATSARGAPPRAPRPRPGRGRPGCGRRSRAPRGGGARRRSPSGPSPARPALP